MRYRVTLEVEVYAPTEMAAMEAVHGMVCRNLAVESSEVADCVEVDETPSDAELAAWNDMPSAAERHELDARDAWKFR